MGHTDQDAQCLADMIRKLKLIPSFQELQKPHPTHLLALSPDPFPRNLSAIGKKQPEKTLYIINHAVGFNRCSTELQDRMSQNISLLNSCISKGKAPKEVSGALNDLRYLMAFHQRVSVAMGTSLQHLADNLFVHFSNLILIRRDSCLDFVKSGVK